MKKLLASLVLFAFASSVSAAELGKRGKKEYMGACGESDAGLIYAITNGSNAASCDATQAVGALRIYCSCTSDGEGGYAWGLLDSALGGEAPDLSPYVLLAGDSDGQVIQGETGVDKARIELGLGGLGLSRIFSGNPNTFIQVGDAEMYFESSTDGVDANTAVLTLSSNELYIDIADGEAGLGVNSVTGFNFTGAAMSFNVPAPSTSTDTCSAGMFAWDASYIYVCTATDNWERTAVAAW